MGKATIPVRQDSKESEFLKNSKMVIRTYAYNIGYSAGSFIFIGFATKDTLEKIKNFNPHNFGNDPISQVVDPAVQLMLVPERKFEKIDSGGVSKPIDNDILLLKENFDKESIIYSVYMDPLGKIYYSESPIKIQDQNKKFNFFEMNVLPKEFLFYLQRR